MKVSRRWILLSGLALFAGGGGLYVWRRVTNPTADDFESLIYARLGHLPLERESVTEFAREYASRYGALSMSVHYRDNFGGMLSFETLRRLAPSERQQRLLTFERRMVSYFLRSTDYFRPDRDPARPIRYVAFADPYEIPCGSNPFARTRT